MVSLSNQNNLSIFELMRKSAIFRGIAGDLGIAGDDEQGAPRTPHRRALTRIASTSAERDVEMKREFCRRTCLWLAVIGSLALMSSIATTVAVASGPPAIEEESVSGITATNAILKAQINPNGGRAHYQFQLVINPDEYASEILCPEPPRSFALCIGEYAAGALSIGFIFEEATPVSLDLSSEGVTLQPDTTYHYRVLAARTIPTEDTIQWEPPIITGVDQTFTTSGTLFPLTIAKTGEGAVTSSPAGLECTGAKTGAECEHAYEQNEMVTLTASPASGYAFGRWAGCTTRLGLTCAVEMSKAKTVKATFVKTPSLTIEKAGPGYGKVAATGISCDESCSGATSAIKTGTSVTVKATPAKDSEAAVFENGTGSASGCSGVSCTFTISENSSVKVKFNPIPTKTLTVDLTGPAAYKGKVTGKGTVKGLTASAINCVSGCTSQTESFFSTDTVTLTAVAGAGYTFAGWSGSEAGTCTGKTSPCTISTSADKTLSAKFE
jgi:uncharacterized repeat protein (TIGR02543 family)